jgi:hypothetical protein
MWKVYLLMFIVVVVVSILWVNAITNMHEKHPDYKGEDWLNWNEDDKLDINLWDKEEKENRKDYDEN